MHILITYTVKFEFITYYLTKIDGKKCTFSTEKYNLHQTFNTPKSTKFIYCSVIQFVILHAFRSAR